MALGRTRVGPVGWRWNAGLAKGGTSALPAAVLCLWPWQSKQCDTSLWGVGSSFISTFEE